MRTRTLLTSCLLSAAIAGVTPVVFAQNQMTTPSTQPTGMDGNATAKVPSGVEPQQVEDKEDLTNVLGEATNAALTNGGFNDLVERFVDQDRNRLGRDDATEDEQLNSKLNARIDQIRKAWMDKYGAELDLDDGSAATFADASFAVGEVKDPNLVKGNWPLEPRGEMDALKRGEQGIMPPAGAADAASPTVGETQIEAANLEEGRQVAIAVLPKRGMAPMVRVSMIGEVASWKIDVPNNLGTMRLRQNLLDHLTKVGEISAQWPADKGEAQAAIARHVLMGIYGVPVRGKDAHGSGAGHNH